VDRLSLSSWLTIDEAARRAAAEEVAQKTGLAFTGFEETSLAPLASFRHADLGVTFRLVPGGRFVMGMTGDELARLRDDLVLRANLAQALGVAGHLIGPSATAGVLAPSAVSGATDPLLRAKSPPRGSRREDDRLPLCRDGVGGDRSPSTARRSGLIPHGLRSEWQIAALGAMSPVVCQWQRIHLFPAGITD
jgi:hypothetical protein